MGGACGSERSSGALGPAEGSEGFWSLEIEVSGLGLWHLGLRCWGLGYGVWAKGLLGFTPLLGFGIQDLGFRAQLFPGGLNPPSTAGGCVAEILTVPNAI